MHTPVHTPTRIRAQTRPLPSHHSWHCETGLRVPQTHHTWYRPPKPQSKSIAANNPTTCTPPMLQRANAPEHKPTYIRGHPDNHQLKPDRVSTTQGRHKWTRAIPWPIDLPLQNQSPIQRTPGNAPNRCQTNSTTNATDTTPLTHQLHAIRAAPEAVNHRVLRHNSNRESPLDRKPAIKEREDKPLRAMTERNLETTREAIEGYTGEEETDATMWHSLRNTWFRPWARQFLY